VTDGETDLAVTLFNNPFAAQALQQGKTFLFRGRAEGTLTHRTMSSPVFLPEDQAEEIRAVYPQTEGLSQRMIASAVRQALSLLPESVRDPLPQPLREQYDLCPLRNAIVQIHQPSSPELLQQARRRLAFEELLELQLGLFAAKSGVRGSAGFTVLQDCSEEFFALLPFEPTGAQRRAVREAMEDLRSGRPMNRLIQGDVGSGKTAVAAALCYTVAKNGGQCALMAPTEILAAQHFRTLSALLEPAGVSCALLTGSLSAEEKRRCCSGLESGSTAVAVGTHALLSGPVHFQRLGLVVTDEQHRFGVAQRAALAQKGDHPHLLVMSATPIPRTLALMIYGDLDVSVLDELPPGRRKIDTFLIGGEKRERAFAFLRSHLQQGEQAYVVCPLVEESELSPTLKAAQEYCAELSAGMLQGCRVGLLHGRLKPQEKDDVMRRFAAGELQVIVSTTVIEVGVDVPNATVLIVENAERFGLSQLHQLRGRVGRGSKKSCCILISDAKNEETLERLHVMTQTGNGFRIAEEDLRLRGPGDFFGARQHGLPALSVADLQADLQLLHQAQQAAQAIMKRDPELALPEHRLLYAQVRRMFEKQGTVLN
ncbi:MAG: ATP-dependent DNA helicase RecG, partial [Firmicutes bacterium]|nr:ATP-dependent DNA helicase RecG [Bacillota bacterium]